MSETKPALTAEEWNRKPKGFPWCRRDAGFALLDGGEPRWFVGVNQAASIEIVGPHGEVSPPKELLHATAAIALYQQSFGFTWEDVDLLRQAAEDAEAEARPYPDGRAEARAPFDDLAGRIAALLPPREGP